MNTLLLSAVVFLTVMEKDTKLTMLRTPYETVDDCRHSRRDMLHLAARWGKSIYITCTPQE